jgi:hypothetical protein
VAVEGLQERDDATGIAAGSIDARTDGIDQIVCGREDDDVAGSSRLSTWKRLAAGDAGGELAEEGRFAEAGIAVEDGELAGSKATRREPLDGVGLDLMQAETGPEVTPDAVAHRVVRSVESRIGHDILPFCRTACDIE